MRKRGHAPAMFSKEKQKSSNVSILEEGLEAVDRA
jgi:hypothetical protein